jgi:hypothetical protein
MSPPEMIRLSEEMAELDLGDARLNRRACRLLETLSRHPDRSIPTACSGWAETKAAYRLFDNEEVAADKLLAPHIRCTVERMMGHDIVLCIQDSTELDYTGKNDIDGLGTLNYDTRRGLYLHPTLAVTPERLPLGLLDCWTWTRPFTDADKESVRWIEGYQRLCEDQQHIWEQAFDTRLVYVADREGDLFGLYADHQQRLAAGTQAADWLIRAQHDRRTADGHKLWTAVEASPELGRIEFALPAARPAQGAAAPAAAGRGRRITQSLRAVRVTLMPPQEHAHQAPVEVTAILAREEDPALGQTPIEWLLLTNLPVESLEQAQEKLSWYLCRWQIEIYFRVLKSGCKIEELQLEKLQRLEPALALYMIIAWRVLYLTMIGRDCPELPASVVFEDEEWRAICIVATRKPPPDTPPTLAEIVRMVAGFGGFLNRKGDGMPGPKTIWIGLQRCKDFVLALEAQHEAQRSGSG